MVRRILFVAFLLAGALLPAGASGEARPPGMAGLAVRIVAATQTDPPGQAVPRVGIEISDTDVWINQAVHITLRVESDSPFVSLEADRGRLDGIEVLALPQERRALDAAGGQRTEHRLDWVLYPQLTGELVAELPVVNYRRDGVVTHRLHLPATRLQVRALPTFVPPTLPVGRMALRVSTPADWLLARHQLNFLELRVLTDGPPGRRPTELLRQFRSDGAISFYPPRDVTDERAARDGSPGERVYEVPFAPAITGKVSLPLLRLQYFDPATGRIVTEQHALGSHVSMARWLMHAATATLLLGLALVLYGLYRLAVRKWRRLRAYRAALHGLRRAATPGELKSALMRVAEAECWPGNLTLAAWLRHWQGRYPGLSWVAEDILHLQALHYGRKEAAMEKLRSDLMELCYQRMPLLRISEYTWQD